MVSNEMSKNFEIAIIGAGISGTTLAIALHHRGLNVTVYEAAHAFGEIGAGVSFSPNAVQAMKICHDGVYEAFEEVCTRNKWSSKQKVWFNYVDGYNKTKSDGSELKADEQPDIAFTIHNSLGQTAVHRARFLDEMVHLLPKGIAHFGKRLCGITEPANDEGKLVMHFTDGTSAETDAVIGCDGIKSAVRRCLFGEDSPSAWPSYTHKYAYRGLISTRDAVAAIGSEVAENSFMHMGPNGHILTFPVDKGETLNLVAFRTTSANWEDPSRLTKPAHQDDLLRDFEGWAPYIQKLLKLTKPDLDIWAIFDLGNNPVPTFCKGRVCIIGDAAHATSPHHGSGAGFCIESSAILASLLASDKVQTVSDIRAVFETFDAVRRERCQWLVQSSRFIGDCYEWRADGVGKDFEIIEREINVRYGIIANVDVEKMCREAVEDFNKRVSA
ncbi:salicylate hydroxylase, putative [Talaromyces stipitatus ATCC 10500]|uniref:Salicylate hydroxylase, putative n=1 Tax=Talaromyces stipitatus (strain ATCC 10500 / CBS 375.48 / QM 6759 / NRRL 1006) TaxID=441959 RepID=B8M358_TALSN|nr:salicylate hydroxylase, putative [Talaromyces stipitatus ATCC 10500]EED22034.1 salicylate hydroxylase, putative [Talaromyces stipitatus ATCC 10500]